MEKKKTLYFGAGWFNEKQNKAYQEAMAALKENPTTLSDSIFIAVATDGDTIRNWKNVCLDGSKRV